MLHVAPHKITCHGGTIVTRRQVTASDITPPDDDVCSSLPIKRFPMNWSKQITSKPEDFGTRLNNIGAAQAAKHLVALSSENRRDGRSVAIRGRFGTTSHSLAIQPFTFSHARKTADGQLVSTISSRALERPSPPNYSYLTPPHTRAQNSTHRSRRARLITTPEQQRSGYLCHVNGSGQGGPGDFSPIQPPNRRYPAKNLFASSVSTTPTTCNRKQHDESGGTIHSDSRYSQSGTKRLTSPKSCSPGLAITTEDDPTTIGHEAAISNTAVQSPSIPFKLKSTGILRVKPDSNSPIRHISINNRTSRMMPHNTETPDLYGTTEPFGVPSEFNRNCSRQSPEHHKYNVVSKENHSRFPKSPKDQVGDEMMNLGPVDGECPANRRATSYGHNDTPRPPKNKTRFVRQPNSQTAVATNPSSSKHPRSDKIRELAQHTVNSHRLDKIYTRSARR